jgi:hypothetical protein
MLEVLVANDTHGSLSPISPFSQWGSSWLLRASEIASARAGTSVSGSSPLHQVSRDGKNISTEKGEQSTPQSAFVDSSHRRRTAFQMQLRVGPTRGFKSSKHEQQGRAKSSIQGQQAYDA